MKEYKEYKRPYVAELDQVIITRPEPDTALIEYKEEYVYSVNLKIGPKMKNMTDQEILDAHNNCILARQEYARGYKHVAIEIPEGSPQVEYSNTTCKWHARGDVLRCKIAWSIETDEASFIIDDKEFSLREFSDIISAYEGWGMRLMFVPDDELHQQHSIVIKNPDEEKASIMLNNDMLSDDLH